MRYVAFLLCLWVALVLPGCQPTQPQPAPDSSPTIQAAMPTVASTLTPFVTPTAEPMPALFVAERRDAGISALTTATSFVVDEGGEWLGSYGSTGLWHRAGEGGLWQPVEEVPGPVYALVRTPNARWAGTGAGVWRDAGAGWKRLEAVPEMGVLGLTTDGEMVYAAMGPEGLWRVEGLAATSLPLPPEVETPGGGALGVAARGPWLLLGTSGAGAWQSLDGGATWQRLPWDEQGFASDLIIGDERKAWVRTGAGIWQTEDGGASWAALESPAATAMLVEQNGLVLGVNGGVVSSADGTAWERVGTGLNEQLRVIELGRDARGRLVVAMQDGLWRLQPDGRWERDEGVGETRVEALALLADGTLLAGHRDGLYRSTDEGRTWQHRGLGNGASVVALASDPHDPQGAWVGTDSAGAWRTDDGGRQWRPLRQQGVVLDFITGLYPDPQEPNHLWARVAYERFYERWEDGRGWHARWEGLDLATQMFTLAFDPHEPGHLWAGAMDGLRRRTLERPSWEVTAPTLQGQTVLALLPDEQRAGPLWVGATRGVYRSEDGGQSVEPTALSNVTVSVLAQTETGVLLAGTRFYGLYISRDGEVWRRVEEVGDRTVTSIVPAPEGVWVATNDGIWLLNGVDGAGRTGASVEAEGVLRTNGAVEGVQAEEDGLGVYAHLLNPSDALFRKAAESGFEGVVVVFPWREIEPNPDEWHWERTDLWVHAAQYYGLKLVVRLDQSPRWAADEEAFTQSLNPLPEEWSTFADFARHVAERYRGKVRGYVLWNEPNLALDWGGQSPDPEGYGDLLRAATPAIRAADPDALIAAGALAPTTRDDAVAMDDLRYLEALLETGAGEFFDVLAVHPYPFGLAPDAPPEANGGLNLNRLRAVIKLLEEYGLEELPLWATEYGYSTDGSGFGQPVTEDQRTAFLAASLAYLPDAYPSVKMVALWNLAEGLADTDEKEGYNLVDDPVLETLLPPRPVPRSANGPYIPPVALADDVRVHLGDSELGLPWWPLLGGQKPSIHWQAGFYLREVPDTPQRLVLETFQVNEFGNGVWLNGQRLHAAPLPVVDFTGQWLTAQLPIEPTLLRVGWNEVEVRAGPLLPDFQQISFVWDDFMLRNVRLEPAP